MGDWWAYEIQVVKEAWSLTWKREIPEKIIWGVAIWVAGLFLHVMLTGTWLGGAMGDWTDQLAIIAIYGVVAPVAVFVGYFGINMVKAPAGLDSKRRTETAKLAAKVSAIEEAAKSPLEIINAYKSSEDGENARLLITLKNNSPAELIGCRARLLSFRTASNNELLREADFGLMTNRLHSEKRGPGRSYPETFNIPRGLPEDIIVARVSDSRFYIQGAQALMRPDLPAGSGKFWVDVQFSSSASDPEERTFLYWQQDTQSCFCAMPRKLTLKETSDLESATGFQAMEAFLGPLDMNPKPKVF